MSQPLKLRQSVMNHQRWYATYGDEKLTLLVPGMEWAIEEAKHWCKERGFFWTYVLAESNQKE